MLTLADSRVPIVFYDFNLLIYFYLFFIGVLLFCVCACGFFFFFGGGGKSGYACGWLYHTEKGYILSYVFQAIYTYFEQQ